MDAAARRRHRLPAEGRADRHPAAARRSGRQGRHQDRRQDEGRPGERQRRHQVGESRKDLRPAIPAGDALRAGLLSGSRSATIPIPIRTTGIRARPSSRRGDRRGLGRRVDWDDWGVWGGRWDGGDIDIDCNNCFNNRDFNGKINFNDVDWKNIDRSKIKIDRDQFNKIDRTAMRTASRRTVATAIRDQGGGHQERPAEHAAAQVRQGSQDIRKSTIDGLKGRATIAKAKPGIRTAARPANACTAAAAGSHAQDRPPGRQAEGRRQGSTTGRRSRRGSAMSIAARPPGSTPTAAASRWAAAIAAAGGAHSRCGGPAAAARARRRGGGGACPMEAGGQT